MIWLRYVRHEDVSRFVAKGWKIHSQMQRHHGFHSVLMSFEGEDDQA